jgi:hypothetical protein
MEKEKRREHENERYRYQVEYAKKEMGRIKVKKAHEE